MENESNRNDPEGETDRKSPPLHGKKSASDRKNLGDASNRRTKQPSPTSTASRGSGGDDIGEDTETRTHPPGLGVASLEPATTEADNDDDAFEIPWVLRDEKRFQALCMEESEEQPASGKPSHSPKPARLKADDESTDPNFASDVPWEGKNEADIHRLHQLYDGEPPLKEMLKQPIGSSAITTEANQEAQSILLSYTPVIPEETATTEEGEPRPSGSDVDNAALSSPSLSRQNARSVNRPGAYSVRGQTTERRSFRGSNAPLEADQVSAYTAPSVDTTVMRTDTSEMAEETEGNNEVFAVALDEEEFHQIVRQEILQDTVQAEVVDPDIKRRTQELELEDQRKRMRLKGLLIIIGLLLLIIGIVVGVLVSTTDEGEAPVDVCDNPVDPDYQLQCQCFQSISTPSTPEAEETYDRLFQILNLTVSEDPYSCKSENVALWWMTNDTFHRNLTLDDDTVASSAQRLRQRYILALLYLTTNGDFWENTDKWLSVEDECDWHGLDCLNQEMFDVDLSRNNLTGTIPSELGLLSSIRILELNHNSVSGTIPENLFKQMSSIRESLSACQPVTFLRFEMIGYLCCLFVTQHHFCRSLTGLINFSNNMIAGTIPEFADLPDQLTELLEMNVTLSPEQLLNVSSLLDIGRLVCKSFSSKTACLDGCLGCSPWFV